MREALARSDFDVAAYESPLMAKSRKKGMSRILRNAGIGTGVLVGGVILVNALFLQDRKHPAPLVHAAPPAPVEAVAASPLAAQPAAPRAASLTPATAPASKPARDAPARSAPAVDPIAEELGRGAANARDARGEGKGRDPIAALIGKEKPEAKADQKNASNRAKADGEARPQPAKKPARNND